MKHQEFDAPNYTQVPNSILGNITDGNKPVPGLMAELEGSELKVLLAICRLTFGFHQDKRRASLTTLEKLTGLSRQGVVNAAGSLVNKGLVERSYDGGVTQWRVAVKPVDYQEAEEVVKSFDYLVKPVDQRSQASGLPSNKETIKKPNKNPTTTRAETAAEKLTDFYLTYISTGKVSQTAVNLINCLLETYSGDDINYAIDQAVKNSTAENNKCTLAYVEAVCERRQSGQPDQKPKRSKNNGHNRTITPAQQPAQATGLGEFIGDFDNLA